MKEQVTKFDFEAAFKALDDIDIPRVGKVKANRPNLHEDTKRVDRLSMLVEDYYSLNDAQEVDDAIEQRKADIAQAKLSRIEKIVDLDAESADELLTSYVDKRIIQCPNCLNLFFKEAADIEPSEEDEKLVNVGEKCQHCGNDSGYTLIGKVAADEAEAPVEEFPAEDTEMPAEEIPAENNELEAVPTEETSEEKEEEKPAEEEKDAEDLELPEVEETEEENKEEKKEESFTQSNSGTVLNELLNVNAPIDLNLRNLGGEGNDVSVLSTAGLSEECENKEECNELLNVNIPVKVDGQELLGKNNNVDVLSTLTEDEDAEEVEHVETDLAEDAQAELIAFAKSLTESEKCVECGNKDNVVVEEEYEASIPSDAEAKIDAFVNSLEENCEKCDEDFEAISPEEAEENIDAFLDTLQENYKNRINEDVSNAEFTAMINNPIYKDCEAGSSNTTYNSEDAVDEDEYDEITDESLNTHISNCLTEIYSNVNSFTATSCEMTDNSLLVEGTISFKSGKTKNTKFEFNKVANGQFKGLNESLIKDSEFTLDYTVNNKVMTVENLGYKFTIDNNLVEGCTKH